jgi:hypothetical protein
MTRRLHVDGETFEVVERAEHPGAYELRWLSGTVAGYGFHTVRNDRSALSDDELVAAVRNFLGQVDPDTGLIG